MVAKNTRIIFSFVNINIICIGNNIRAASASIVDDYEELENYDESKYDDIDTQAFYSESSASCGNRFVTPVNKNLPFGNEEIEYTVFEAVELLKKASDNKWKELEMLM